MLARSLLYYPGVVQLGHTEDVFVESETVKGRKVFLPLRGRIKGNRNFLFLENVRVFHRVRANPAQGVG